jgi:hypothetical protein
MTEALGSVAKCIAFGLAIGALFSASACGSNGHGGATAAAPTTDGSASTEDAGSDAPMSTTPATCDDACRKTDLVVTFDGNSEKLTRAQFGFVVSDGGGAQKLHIEAHDGGSPACPTESSPTTDRTLVLEDVPVRDPDTEVTSSDGVRAAFFDFAGTLLPNTPLAKATKVTLRTRAVVDEANVLRGIAFDVDIVFPQHMTLKGHLFAEHCASMD